MSLDPDPVGQAPPPILQSVRPYYWSLRRELWEHRAVYVAPLVVGAFALFASLLGTMVLPHAMRTIAAGDLKRVGHLMGPYSFEAFSVLLIGWIVAVFYALNALYGERRDRSILFWKSLPVSDRTTVLAKATVPLVITPIVTFAIIVAIQLIVLVWSSLVVLMNGLDPTLYWAHADLSLMWVVLPYGLALNALWQAPLFAWFILVSGWAKRTPFLWAFAPVFLPMMLEQIAWRTHHYARFMGERFFGGFGEAFSIGGQGEAPIQEIGQIDPLRTLALPDIWLGLVVAALFLAAAIWLRRRREPI